PRLGGFVVAQAHAVGVTEHGVALAVLGPVAAGHVLVRRKGCPVGLRAGQDVVLIDGVQAARDQAAVLGGDGLGPDLVVGRVQVGDAGGDGDALGVDPRTLADAVLGVDGGGGADGLRAEIGAPGLVAGAGLGGQRLAVTIGAVETAVVGALR